MRISFICLIIMNFCMAAPDVDEQLRLYRKFESNVQKFCVLNGESNLISRLSMKLSRMYKNEVLQKMETEEDLSDLEYKFLDEHGIKGSRYELVMAFHLYDSKVQTFSRKDIKYIESHNNLPLKFKMSYWNMRDCFIGTGIDNQ